MKIGQYVSKEKLTPRGAGVAVDPASAGTVGNALANLGDTVFDVVRKYHERQRAADQVKDYHNAVIEMHRTIMDIDQNLQQDPDPDGYMERYRQQYTEKRNEILSRLKDPETQNKVSMAFDELDLSATGHVQKLAWTRKASRARADLESDIEYWQNAGNLDQIRRILEDGKNAMIITPEYAQQVESKAKREIAITRARLDIQADPYKFVKARYPELGQNDLLALQNEAEAEANQREIRAQQEQLRIEKETGSQALDLYFEKKLTPAWLTKQHRARRLSDNYYQSLMAALKKPGGQADQTDLYTYAILEGRASRGELTPQDVLDQADKLTVSDAKSLIEKSLKKDVDPKDVEVKAWRGWLEQSLAPDGVEKLDSDGMNQYVNTMVQFDKGVKDVEAGKIGDYAKKILEPHQKSIIEKILEGVKNRINDNIYRDAGVGRPNTGAINQRADGTKKGPGYFGELKRPGGRVSTELSVGVRINGKETEIPTLVPTLTQKELDYLLAGGAPTKQIIDKAVQYAKGRIAEGKSPFAQPGEQQPLARWSWPKRVEGVPDVLVKEICLFLERNGKPVTSRNIKYIYDHRKEVGNGG